MANDRPEIKWASFGPGVRINASAMETPAVAQEGPRRIYKDVVNGDVSLVVEDPSLPAPVVVPWHNVGTVVYETVEVKKPVAKVKAAEA